MVAGHLLHPQLAEEDPPQLQQCSPEGECKDSDSEDSLLDDRQLSLTCMGSAQAFVSAQKR